MKFKVGQKWKNRVGKVFIIKRIDMNAPYPIYAIEYNNKNDTDAWSMWLYSLNGAFSINGTLKDNMDLVKLVEENEVTKEEYEEIREEEKVQSEPMEQVFQSDVTETLTQRGSVYGSFSAQLDCVTDIVYAMEKCARANGQVELTYLKTEWYYLAIKLARIASNPNHTDSYHDLAGYAMLLEKEYEHTN
jgi:hypothetical protein